jgi:hypothetical protein
MIHDSRGGMVLACLLVTHSLSQSYCRRQGAVMRPNAFKRRFAQVGFQQTHVDPGSLGLLPGIAQVVAQCIVFGHSITIGDAAKKPRRENGIFRFAPDLDLALAPPWNSRIWTNDSSAIT